MAFVGNLVKTPAALAKLAGDISHARGVKAAFMSHLQQAGNASFMKEHYHTWYCTWMVSDKDLHVCDNLPIARKDFSRYVVAREDMDRMYQPAMAALLGGGVPAVVGLPFWCGSPHLLPSTFFSGADQQREAGIMRDQEVHVKFAPACAHQHLATLEYWAAMEPKFNEAFDSIGHGFTAKKDAKAIRRFAQFAGKVEGSSLPYVRMDVGGWFRGTDCYQTCAFLGKPIFGVSARAMAARFVEHYRDLYQEDKLIQKEGLSTIDDHELYQICSRRNVARWEEGLNRARLEDRYSKWATLTEVKEGSDYVPLRVVVAYQTAHYRDPGFLDSTLSELDEDAFPAALSWPNDAFQRRLEFENGPLADQVRAYVAQQEAAEKKLLEA
eukprot:TRINITY_DN8517_c0_g1_i1.p1 TRINITY_DN8517_c0_g1~~TRINITY_DN8517_c0_g1_i1.p1  ORF type:complete len:409 (+),score=160.56 TRINITY_DN8517_c0_g1_i1:83-1228(+)